MARRAPKRPSVSVIMTLRDASASLARSAESVLAQRFDDVQLVLAVLPSRDQTLASAERLAERDIRVDVLELDDVSRAAAFDAAFEAARGTYVIALGQGDWFGLQSLEQLVAVTRDEDLELACPALSFDRYRASGDVVSRVAPVTPVASADTATFRAQLHRYVEGDALSSIDAKLMVRDRVEDLGLRMELCRDDIAFLLGYIEGVGRTAVVTDALYHTAGMGPLDTYPQGARERGVRVEREHQALCTLAEHWGMADDETLMHAIHRRHLRQIIACVEDVCTSRGVSSIERNARVHDMLEAASTRETVDALAGTRNLQRDFGFMYSSIARKDVLACCLYARMAELMRTTRLPFGARTASVA